MGLLLTSLVLCINHNLISHYLRKKFVKFIVSLDLLFYTENLANDVNPNYCVLFVRLCVTSLLHRTIIDITCIMYQSQLDILLLEKKFVKFIVSLDLLFYTENLTIDKNPNYCVLFIIFLFKNKNKIILDFEYSFCIKKLK